MNDCTPDLALIGAGYWGKNLARNFLALGRLHTLSDPSSQILGSYGDNYVSVRKTESLAEVLKNTEITKVAIASPAHSHYNIAKQALLSGKDVYVEKPLCLDVSEAEELQNLSAQHGRVLMVGHLLQYHSCVQQIYRMVRDGALGRLQYITSSRLNLGKIRQEENALWSFAPHDISVILSLLEGQLPSQVRCVGGNYLTSDIADTTLTTMRFDHGVRAHVHVSWLNPFKEQKLTIIGSKGMVVFDDTKPWAQKLLFHEDYLCWTSGRVPTPIKIEGVYIATPELEPLLEECRHFLNCCETRTTPRTDAAEGIRVLKVLTAAQRSLESDGEGKSPARVKSGGYFHHPSALVDPGAKIGAGTKIWHFTHICSGAVIGERCNFGQNTFVADDVSIGSNVKVQNNVSIYSGTAIEDDVFLGPACVLTNVTNPRSQITRHSLYEKTYIRRGATIGANATIVCGVTVGRYAFVAAGSVVTKDVPDYALVMGNPARQKGWMSRHGHKLRAGSGGVMVCPESGFRYSLSESGILSCLDLGECSELPDQQVLPCKNYRQITPRTP